MLRRLGMMLKLKAFLKFCQLIGAKRPNKQTYTNLNGLEIKRTTSVGIQGAKVQYSKKTISEKYLLGDSNII